ESHSSASRNSWVGLDFVTADSIFPFEAKELNHEREGLTMAFGIIHYFPGGTKENYEASIAAVHPANGLPDGQIFHAAGASPDGWTIVAVHESQQSWEKFRDDVL